MIANMAPNEAQLINGRLTLLGYWPIRLGPLGGLGGDRRDHFIKWETRWKIPAHMPMLTAAEVVNETIATQFNCTHR